MVLFAPMTDVAIWARVRPTAIAAMSLGVQPFCAAPAVPGGGWTQAICSLPTSGRVGAGSACANAGAQKIAVAAQTSRVAAKAVSFKLMLSCKGAPRSRGQRTMLGVGEGGRAGRATISALTGRRACASSAAADVDPAYRWTASALHEAGAAAGVDVTAGARTALARRDRNLTGAGAPLATPCRQIDRRGKASVRHGRGYARTAV